MLVYQRDTTTKNEPFWNPLSSVQNPCGDGAFAKWSSKLLEEIHDTESAAPSGGGKGSSADHLKRATFLRGVRGFTFLFEMFDSLSFGVRSEDAARC